MTGYTVEAFKWTGTGYNAVYNTSHTATLSDNDTAYQGAGDGDEKVSIDGGVATSTEGQPYTIKVAFTDTDGDPHVESFYFFNTDGNWYFAPGENSEFTEGATLGNYQSHTVGWDYASVTCFAKGTLIETEAGPVHVELLQPNDRIVVLGGGTNTLRFKMHRTIGAAELQANPKLRPVKIVAGALGQGLPKTDLWISRQHRMLVSSPISKRMFGQSEVLIAAIKLTEWPGCFIDEEIDEVSYFHLIFDRHEIVSANGAPSESFFPGKEAIKTVPRAARQELCEIFPGFQDHGGVLEHARLVPENRQQNQLVARHVKNNKPLLSGAVDLSFGQSR
jgi:hypothetical protein